MKSTIHTKLAGQTLFTPAHSSTNTFVQRIINYSREELRRDEDRRINELIGRLTNSPPRHGLQTNKNLLSSPKTFPAEPGDVRRFLARQLDGRRLHGHGPVQTNQPAARYLEDPWIISKMVPFSGRMTAERPSCPQPLVASIYGSMGWWNWMTVDLVADYYREPREEYARVFVNDARQRLEFCGAGVDGTCKLKAQTRYDRCTDT